MEDLPVLHKLQHGTFPLSISAMERFRIGHQLTKFCWESSLLFRLWPNGTRLIVPRHDQMASLVRQVHEELGHFGIHMTHSMLFGQYWWTNMALPITILGYRWSLNFVRLLVVTSRGAKYVL